MSQWLLRCSCTFSHLRVGRHSTVRTQHFTGSDSDMITITAGGYGNIVRVLCYSSDHNRIVRSFSIDADAIKFRVGCV